MNFIFVLLIVVVCVVFVDVVRYSVIVVVVFFILVFIVFVLKKWLNKCKFNVNIVDCVFIILKLNKLMVV